MRVNILCRRLCLLSRLVFLVFLKWDFVFGNLIKQLLCWGRYHTNQTLSLPLQQNFERLMHEHYRCSFWCLHPFIVTISQCLYPFWINPFLSFCLDFLPPTIRIQSTHSSLTLPTQHETLRSKLLAIYSLSPDLWFILINGKPLMFEFCINHQTRSVAVHCGCGFKFCLNLFERCNVGMFPCVYHFANEIEWANLWGDFNIFLECVID